MSALLECLVQSMCKNKCDCCIKLFNKSFYIAFQTYAKYTLGFSSTNEDEVKTTTTTTDTEQTVLLWRQRSILGKQLLG